MSFFVFDSLLGYLSMVWGFTPIYPRWGLCPCLGLSKQILIEVSRGRTSSRGGAPSGGEAPTSNVLRASLGRIFGRVAPKNSSYQ